MTFDWDDANIGHIARHDVAPAEAEQAISGDTLYLGGYIRRREYRETYLGITGAGRVLKVTITIRRNTVRVVTAHDASKREKKRYAKVV